MKLLQGKTIMLGVTGSIAAFKAVGLASRLTQQGAAVDVILTKNACELVTPKSFEAVTHRPCFCDTFEHTDTLSALHVSIAERADLAVIAPCSANMIGKLTHGIADDKLSTAMLAMQCPCVIAPAMNTRMLDSLAVQENLDTLRRRGVLVMEPGAGSLACGAVGRGRMPEPETIVELAAKLLAMPKVLAGHRVLVTAGATREFIDAVRFISNPSTGKMGYACARAALMAGADVTLVTAPTALPPVAGAKMVQTVSADEMAEAVIANASLANIIIMAAAVADFAPQAPVDFKMHKTDAPDTISLRPTRDILAELGRIKRPGQFLCGFCMETENLCDRAQQKMHEKHLDMIAANNLHEPGCGFAHDTNGVYLVTQNGMRKLPVADKLEIAMDIIREIGKLI